MRLFATAQTAQAADRRTTTRLRIDHPARLLMPSGDRTGRLYDISADGARFITDFPPKVGLAAILDWTLYESYCHVAWSRPGMCGVKFDRPLHQRVLDDLAAAMPSGPRLVHSSDNPARAPTRFVC